MAYLLGMIVGATGGVYILRGLFLYLFKKFLNINEDRKSKNLGLILATVFATWLYYIASNEFYFQFIMGGIILFLLGLIPDFKSRPVKE